MLQYVQGTIIWGMTLPAVVAGVLVAAAWRPWSEEGGKAYWGAPLGIAGGYFVAHYGLEGDPASMPYVLALAAGAGILEAVLHHTGGDDGRWRRVVIWAVRVAAIPVVTYLVAGFMFENYWEGAAAVLWPALFAAVAAAMVGGLEYFGERYRGATAPLAMIVLGSAAAFVLATLGTARVGELLGALTATAGAALVLAWWDAELRLSRGGMTTFVLIFAALGIYAYTGLYGEEQTVAGEALIVLGLSPQLMWVAALGFGDRLDGWKGAAVRVGLVGVGAAAAVGWALFAV